MVDWEKAVWNAICKLHDLSRSRSHRFWKDQLMDPKRMEEMIADSGCHRDSQQSPETTVGFTLTKMLNDKSLPPRFMRVGHGEYKLTAFGLVECKLKIARETDPENKVLRESLKKEWHRLYDDWDSTVR